MKLHVEEPKGDMAICEAHEGSKWKGVRGCSRKAVFVVIAGNDEHVLYLSERCVGKVMLQVREG